MSDKGSRGEREDTSGPYLLKTLNDLGYKQKAYKIIPDQVDVIKETLISWVDVEKVDLIITTGATLSAYANILKTIGAKKITGVSCCTPSFGF